MQNQSTQKSANISKNEQNQQTPPDVNFDTYEFKQNYPELEELYNFKNKRLTSNINKINFVVTHGKCSDGFMSEIVVRMFLLKIGIDLDTVIFYHAYYNTDFSKLPEMMKDKFVIICDFSFQKTIFDKMVETTNGNILILDHHKTAQKMLQDIPAEYLVFDMKHSGAFITWTYFFGFLNVPKAILYVEDNDIWTKKLPHTREFTSYMFSQPFEFDQYVKLFNDAYLIETVFPTGKGMVIQNDAHLKELDKKCIPYFVQIKNRYYFVACVNNAGLLTSDIGNFVLGTFKNANFSMIYSHNQFTGNTNISYRSLDDRTDASEIAKVNGGGGHRNACGSGYVPYRVDTPPGRIVDSYKTYFALNEIYEVNINNDKFLALNSSMNKKHLAQYLMQERFFNDENVTKNCDRITNNLPGYQEGMFCMKNRYENPTYDAHYKGAYIWHYDGMHNIFKFVIKTLPETITADKVKTFENLNISVKIIKNDLFKFESNFTPEDIIKRFYL